MKQILSEEKLKKIVADYVGCDINEISLWAGTGRSIHYYHPRSSNNIDDTLIFYAPWMDGLDGSMCRSSRVIFINKYSGEIVGNGNAGDEG